MQTPLERETYQCPDCRVWDPEKVQDHGKYVGRLVVGIRNGTTMCFDRINHINLWTDMLTCPVHQKKWEETDE